MSRIPQAFIDDLLYRTDIVEIIDQRVKLKRSGKNYSACCPFHDEKTPSFTVSPEKQFYYCFGCGATGTAISFLMEYDRLGFVDAVESLAKTAGVEVPKEERRDDDGRELQRKRSYTMLERAAHYYEEQLKNHPQRNYAVKYLQNRGLSGQIAKAYGLGYAPPGWDNLLLRLSQNEADQKLLVDTGLTVEKNEENKRYDRFRNRIMFPIRDGRGRVIGFGGRVLGDDKPKYLNSPETEVFHKGRELYGIYETRKYAKQLDFIIVVEGYMDVIALAQYGLWNAVATLGTACGEEHLNLAFRHVNEVIFCFDGDNAGRAAAKRALMSSLQAMQDGRQIRFLFLPEGQDPDSLVRQIGADRFKALLKNALPMEDFLFDVAADDIDLNSMDGRARFSKMAAPLIHRLPEGIFKQLMFDELAKRTGLSNDVLSEFTHMDEESLGLKEDKSNQESEHLHPASNPEPGEIRQAPASRRSNLNINPARSAIVLILDQPALLQKCSEELSLPETMLADNEISTLNEIIAYLRNRPDANFNNIMGYWGGAKGVDAQQALAKLVASQIFGDLKQVDRYDPLAELSACIVALNKAGRRATLAQELAQLNAKGLSNLNAAEKQRYVELTRSN